MRERIDSVLGQVGILHQDKQVIKRSFLEKATAIRTIQQQISGKGRLQTEIRDLDAQIALFQQSGIADLLTKREKFNKEDRSIKAFTTEIEKRENVLDRLMSAIELTDVDYDGFEERHSNELKTHSQIVI